MKKIYSLLTLALFAIVVSCTDDDLDPLNFKKVSKGTLLALRGDALQSIYEDGSPYSSSFVPLIADGTETFSYDAEYLSDDPTSLESIDIYVEDKNGTRTLLKNVSASEFKTTEDYPRPWVSVSFTLAEILPLIDIPAEFPISNVKDADHNNDVDSLLTRYATGITIVTDLNLKDGSKVLADDLVAAGLYQSNQFYPAQRLPFGVVEYCPYEESTWEGTYKALEIADETVGPYEVVFTEIDDNVFEVSNIFDGEKDGDFYTIELTLAPSSSPYDQDVTVETVNINGTDFEAEGSYDQCTGVITLKVIYGQDEDGEDIKFTYQFKKKT